MNLVRAFREIVLNESKLVPVFLTTFNYVQNGLEIAHELGIASTRAFLLWSYFGVFLSHSAKPKTT